MLLVKQNVLKSYAKYWVAGAALLSFPTYAASAASPDILRMIMSLLVVLAVIFLLSFVVKKLKITPHSQKHLRTVANLSVGQKERVVVVEVNGEQLLLGVTAHSVNLIHKLDKPIADVPTGESQTSGNIPLTIQSLLKKGKS